jgi:prepilin-type N-terminal cleavage/methylation domain-containing protein
LKPSQTRSVDSERPFTYRAGLTLLEVLVAIGVVGILAALTLPAVQSGRESSRRMACLSNLRQLGQATENFVAATRRYPRFHAYGLDHQGPTSRASVHVQLLPYLDQQPLYDQLDLFAISSLVDPPSAVHEGNAQALKQTVPLFICPSDSASHPGRNNYRACYGTSPGIHATWAPGRPRRGPLELEALGGIFLGNRTPARVRDGQSQTMLFSERVVGDGDPARYNPWTDLAVTDGSHHYFPNDAAIGCAAMSSVDRHASYLGWTWLTQGHAQTAYNHILPPNSRVPDCVDEWNSSGAGQGAFTARSQHPGGVNGVLADGSARFFNESIDLTVWRALATIHGEEVVGAF